jgi:hypothetical protein
MMGTAVLKATSLFLIKVMEAMAMLIPFKSRAVAMASFRGTPSQKKSGIMMKAAPTPAMVSTVVKPKTIRLAKNRVAMEILLSFYSEIHL